MMPATEPDRAISHYHPHLAGLRAMNSRSLSTITSSPIGTEGSSQCDSVPQRSCRGESSFTPSALCGDWLQGLSDRSNQSAE